MSESITLTQSRDLGPLPNILQDAVTQLQAQEHKYTTKEPSEALVDTELFLKMFQSCMQFTTKNKFCLVSRIWLLTLPERGILMYGVHPNHATAAFLPCPVDGMAITGLSKDLEKPLREAVEKGKTDAKMELHQSGSGNVHLDSGSFSFATENQIFDTDYNAKPMSILHVFQKDTDRKGLWIGKDEFVRALRTFTQDDGHVELQANENWDEISLTHTTDWQDNSGELLAICPERLADGLGMLPDVPRDEDNEADKGEVCVTIIPEQLMVVGNRPYDFAYTIMGKRLLITK